MRMCFISYYIFAKVFVFCILFLLHPIIHQLYNNTIVVQSIIIINNNINNTIVVQYQLAQSCLNYLYIIMITKEEN